MFDEFKDKLINILTSRLTVFAILFILFGGILVYRCFQLQIVHGQEYLDEFVLETEKTRDIASARGNIFDRNGNLLAYNELAYSVKIEDVFESGNGKNARMNEVVFNLIQMIEKNGDKCNTDFRIIVDENGEFAFNAEGTSLLRFLADVYGRKTIDLLQDSERTATAADVMEFLSRTNKFGIGEYAEPGNTKSDFLAGKGYSKEEWLKIVTIRYAMSLTSFRKYIGTTVATNINERTVAVLMENSDVLPGVTIVEDTVRRYVDSKYFAHVLGYTGKISSDELTQLNEEMLQNGGSGDEYTINDVVGKSGIEASLETTLQGRKGYERVVVDSMGKVLFIPEREEAQVGQDVYLTIDRDLTKAVYNILEQKLAGLVSSKIINAREYKAEPDAESGDIKIPIYDVYFAMFNNSIIDIKHLSAENAGETEKAVYAAYAGYKDAVYERLKEELTEKKTPYNRLSKEYQVYQSNIVTLLNRSGIIMSVDTSDETYINWATKEIISLNEYLRYCITKNWIDVSKLQLDDKYSDSTEIYEKLLEHIISTVDKNMEFQKKLFKYMLLSDEIGRASCRERVSASV